MPQSSVAEALRSALTIMVRKEADPGHDSPAERHAVEDVSAYAKRTNFGEGAATVRAFAENGFHVVAWVGGGYPDSIAVRITPKETYWAFADTPDEAIPAKEWKPLYGDKAQPHDVAKGVHAIVYRHFGAQLQAAQPS